MLDGAFMFSGRIGRLNFFLASLLMIPAALVAGVVLALLAAGAERGLATVVFFGFLIVLLAVVAGWYTLSLQVRRIRDIGWDPFIVLVGWFMIACGDVVLAKLVPAMAIGHAHTGTAIGALVNLGLSLSLWFWPSRDGDVGTPTTRPPPGPSRLDTLVGGDARYEAAPTATIARLPGAAPQGFGRRGAR